jgi:hypothetical protein
LHLSAIIFTCISTTRNIINGVMVLLLLLITNAPFTHLCIGFCFVFWGFFVNFSIHNSLFKSLFSLQVANCKTYHFCHGHTIKPIVSFLATSTLQIRWAFPRNIKGIRSVAQFIILYLWVRKKAKMETRRYLSFHQDWLVWSEGKISLICKTYSQNSQNFQ